METEIPALLRARQARRPEAAFTFHSSRMRMHTVEKAELVRMNAQALRCAAELADARVDVMSTACLVALMAMGPGHHRTAEREIEAAAREAGSQAQVMTSAGALVDGLKALGARRVAMMMPYTDALAQAVVSYIEAEHIEVVHWLNFSIADNLAVGRRPAARLLEDAARLDLSRADVVVASACVQMPSLAALQPLQERLGLPVTSTAACTAWQMLTRLGLETPLPDARLCEGAA
ncbi:Asp/Glu racemase [Aquabacterium sp. J223]|nr:Asp/Glu racemase [Aquabacterium sp. J223]